MKKMIIGLCLALFLLTACAPDPRKEAAAKATVIAAEQDALDAAQMRQIEREQADAEKARAEWWAAVWAAGLENAKAGMQTLVTVTSWMFAIGLGVVILSAAQTTRATMAGVGLAVVTAAQLQANLVHMDRSTRTYPMLRQAHGKRWALAIPNTGQVMMLDERIAADRQLIAAFAQVSATGAAFQEMRSSHDAAGMAVFQPEIITAREGALTVGVEGD